MNKVIIFKKVLLVSIILCLGLSLVSCKQDQSLSESVFIEGMGIDIDDNDPNNYKIYLQIFNPSKGAATLQDQEGTVTSMIEIEGPAVLKAIRNITEKVGKNVSYSHNQIIIISEEIAKNGLNSVIDFFMRYYDSLGTVDVAICKGKVKDAMSSTMNNSLKPAEEMKRLQEIGDQNSETIPTTVIDVIKNLQDSESDFAIPLFEVIDSKGEKTEIQEKGSEEQGDKEEEKAKKKLVTLNGSAVFRNDKMRGTITKEEARIYCLLRKNIEKGVEAAEVPDIGKVSVELLEGKSNVKFDYVNSKLLINIKVNYKFSVQEVISDSMRGVTEQDEKMVVDTFDKRIKAGVEQSVSKVLKQDGSDIYRFTRRMKLFYPKIYKQLRDDLPGAYSQAEINAEVHGELINTGKLKNI